jgi:hypothetical protein
LAEEKIKAQQKHPWVRLTCRSGLDAESLAAAAHSQLQDDMPGWDECPRGIIIHTASIEDRNVLLGLQSAKVDGHLISASTQEYVMKADKIFDFITSRLRVEEEVRETRTNLGIAEPHTHRPAAVAAQVQFTTPDGKGRTRSGSGDRGGGKFAESKARAPQYTPLSETECTQCKLAGREFLHNYRTCEVFKKVCDEMRERNKILSTSGCRRCAQAGRAANHDFRKCYYDPANRGRGGSGKKPEGQPAGTAQQGSQ